MVKTPDVSVVVIFFNQSEHVNGCIESILCNEGIDFEIICIDDGSTDETGKILDSISSAVVRVFHKDNGGPADARNFGASVANGRYVTFVDGDDYVSPFYLQSLTNAINMGSGTTMAVGKTQVSKVGQAISWEMPRGYSNITQEEFIKMMMYEEVLPSACARLAPREIYTENRMPVGLAYEDVATAARYALSVDSIVLIDEPIYAYVMRGGSVVHRRRAGIKQARDYSRAISMFSSAASEIVPEDSAPQIYFRCLHLSRLLRLLDTVEDNRGDALRMRDGLTRYIRRHFTVVLKDGRASPANKVRFMLLALCPLLYKSIFNVYEHHFKGV